MPRKTRKIQSNKTVLKLEEIRRMEINLRRSVMCINFLKRLKS